MSDKNENFDLCHSADKCKRAVPLGFFNIHSVAEYEKY